MPKPLIALALLAVLVSSAVASDLDSLAPAKPAATHPAPPPDPNVIRQGGDTMADALLLAIPAVVSGTTAGYTHDYDEACPYTDSIAPDVVYRLAPHVDVVVDIDMLGSFYDTKIYVYREDFTLVACNDDFYPDYVSKLEDVALDGDVKYFLVIDGYGDSFGDYELRVESGPPCDVVCPAGPVPEDEPTLEDGYIDDFNGGCDSADLGYAPMSNLGFDVVCGVSGWYAADDGTPRRDTDWYEVWLPDYYGHVMIHADAEYETRVVHVAPNDCGNLEVVDQMVVGPCAGGELIVEGEPNSMAWIWLAPVAYSGPVNEYDYVLEVGYPVTASPVATKAQSWSEIKALFH